MKFWISLEKKYENFGEKRGSLKKSLLSNVTLTEPILAILNAEKRNLSIINLRNIADALGVSLSKLFEDFSATEFNRVSTKTYRVIKSEQISLLSAVLLLPLMILPMQR